MYSEFLIYLSIHLSEYGNLDKKKKEKKKICGNKITKTHL